MSATLTIDLPEDVKTTLGKAAREDGVSENAFAARALEDYLRLRRFKKLNGGKPREADVNSLKRTMDEIGRKAKAMGLTPAKARGILKGIDTNIEREADRV